MQAYFTLAFAPGAVDQCTNKAEKARFEISGIPQPARNLSPTRHPKFNQDRPQGLPPMPAGTPFTPNNVSEPSPRSTDPHHQNTPQSPKVCLTPLRQPAHNTAPHHQNPFQSSGPSIAPLRQLANTIAPIQDPLILNPRPLNHEGWHLSQPQQYYATTDPQAHGLLNRPTGFNNHRALPYHALSMSANPNSREMKPYKNDVLPAAGRSGQNKYQPGPSSTEVKSDISQPTSYSSLFPSMNQTCTYGLPTSITLAVGVPVPGYKAGQMIHRQGDHRPFGVESQDQLKSNAVEDAQPPSISANAAGSCIPLNRYLAKYTEDALELSEEGTDSSLPKKRAKTG